MRPPRLRCTLFPFIYPPHLLLLPATFGLYLLLQTYPYFRALYVIPVRRTKGLPTASFRFHLTMDTLAVQLYTSSLPRRVRDFHPLERAHGAQTKRPENESRLSLIHIFRNVGDRDHERLAAQHNVARVCSYTVDAKCFVSVLDVYKRQGHDHASSDGCGYGQGYPGIYRL